MSFDRIGSISTRMLNEHLADAVRHITAAERTLWNDKSYITSGDFKLTAPALTANAIASIEGHGHNIGDIAGLADQLAAVLHWKGVKDSYADLPATGNAAGDVWGVGTDEYVWNGEAWEKLGSTYDFSGFATTEALNAAIAQEVIDRNAAIKVVSDQLAEDKAELAGDISDLDTKIGQETTNRQAAINAIDGSTVKLTGYTSEEDDVLVLAATNSVNTAFRSVVNHLNTLDEISGGNTGDLTALTSRVSANEGNIEDIQATLVGYSKTATVADAIATAKSGAEATAAADAASKANAAQAAAEATASADATSKANAAQANAEATAAADATAKADAAKDAAIAAAATDAKGKADAAQAAAIAAAAEDATTKAGTAKSEAIAAAAEDATSKAATAKSEAIAAAETKAGELDAALHTTITGEIATAKSGAISAAETKAGELDAALHNTITGEIATAKSQAIADADGKLASAKTEIDGRLDALEAIKDHGAEFSGAAAITAATILADLKAYAMKVVYTAADGGSFVLPTSADLNGYAAEVTIIVPAGASVTVGDGGSQSETFTAPSDQAMAYVFGTRMTSAEAFSWFLNI